MQISSRIRKRECFRIFKTPSVDNTQKKHFPYMPDKHSVDHHFCLWQMLCRNFVNQVFQFSIVGYLIQKSVKLC